MNTKILTVITFGAVIGCGGGPASQPAPVAAGTVEMKNASARLVGPGEYSITFVLDNHSFETHHVARADLVRLHWSGQLVRANIACTQWPFVNTVISNGATAELSSVITVQLHMPSDKPASTSVQCGGNNTIPVALDGSPAGAPKSGDLVTVAVDGILDDATPFSAVEQAPVL